LNGARSPGRRYPYQIARFARVYFGARYYRGVDFIVNIYELLLVARAPRLPLLSVAVVVFVVVAAAAIDLLAIDSYLARLLPTLALSPSTSRSP